MNDGGSAEILASNTATATTSEPHSSGGSGLRVHPGLEPAGRYVRCSSPATAAMAPPRATHAQAARAAAPRANRGPFSTSCAC
eukprot:6637740-Prymnesium_polylepis.1